MKRIAAAAFTAALLFAVGICAPGASDAKDWPAYGYHGIAFKIEYIDFTDSVLSSRDVDAGIMIGIEGYRRLASGLYFGGEVGFANIEGTAGGAPTELNYLPLELNVRYTGEAAPQTMIDVGGGASFNYVDEKGVLGAGSETDDWVLGAQVFASLNYVSGSYFAGLTAKYQITQNYDDPTTGGTRFGMNNWRVGGQAGMSF